MNNFFCSVGKNLANKIVPVPNPLLSSDYEVKNDETEFYFKIYISSKSIITGFKKEIKSWSGADCTCRLCRTFIPQLGYLQYHDNRSSIFRFLICSDFYNTVFFILP